MTANNYDPITSIQRALDLVRNAYNATDADLDRFIRPYTSRGLHPRGEDAAVIKTQALDRLKDANRRVRVALEMGLAETRMRQGKARTAFDQSPDGQRVYAMLPGLAVLTRNDSADTLADRITLALQDGNQVQARALAALAEGHPKPSPSLMIARQNAQAAAITPDEQAAHDLEAQIRGIQFRFEHSAYKQGDVVTDLVEGRDPVHNFYSPDWVMGRTAAPNDAVTVTSQAPGQGSQD